MRLMHGGSLSDDEDQAMLIHRDHQMIGQTQPILVLVILEDLSVAKQANEEVHSFFFL